MAATNEFHDACDAVGVALPRPVPDHDTTSAHPTFCPLLPPHRSGHRVGTIESAYAFGTGAAGLWRPELLRSLRCRVVALALEVGGRRLLARCNARAVPQAANPAAIAAYTTYFERLPSSAKGILDAGDGGKRVMRPELRQLTHASAAGMLGRWREGWARQCAIARAAW